MTTPEIQDHNLVGRSQAARLAGCSELTIDRWRRAGRLHCIPLGKRRAYRRADVLLAAMPRQP